MLRDARRRARASAAQVRGEQRVDGRRARLAVIDETIARHALEPGADLFGDAPAVQVGFLGDYLEAYQTESGETEAGDGQHRERRDTQPPMAAPRPVADVTAPIDLIDLIDRFDVPESYPYRFSTIEANSSLRTLGMSATGPMRGPWLSHNH